MIQIFSLYKDNKEMLIIYSLAFIFAILIAMCSHEFAHAKVAYKCGDDTARLSGRMTLNPLAHLNLLGALSFLLIGFGWANPVPINPLKFKEYRKGIFLTSIAGVLTNFIICFFACGLSILFTYFYTAVEIGGALYYILFFLATMFSFTATVNFSLCLFNLLPLKPLDGYNVLQSVTKGNNKFVRFLGNYSYIILLVLLISNIFEMGMNFAVSHCLMPIYSFWLLVLI